MNVTIIADASVCPDTGAAGYSFWIACERGKEGKHGPMRELVRDSTEGEMMALLNGLHYAHKQLYIMPGDEVLLQSDCRNALEILKTFRKHKKPEVDKLIRFYHKLVKAAGVEVRFKHVKGHTKLAVKGARFTVNRKCDKEARKGMKARRKLLEKENG